MPKNPSELSADYPDDRPFAVEIDLPVLWGHMDANGHVNNVVYFRYFESARVEYLMRMDLHRNIDREPISSLLASTRCDFIAPLKFPDTVTVGARLVKVGNTSAVIHYRLKSKAQGRVVARAESTIVMVNAHGKPTSIDGELREAIQKVEGGGQGNQGPGPLYHDPVE